MSLWSRVTEWLCGRWGGPTSLGERGERWAARYLEERGLLIIARQYRTALGEIDLIARDGDWLVFVEVKTRQGTEKGHPFDAVDSRKQRRLMRLAEAYLAEARRRRVPGIDTQRVRFDVVGIIVPGDGQPPRIEHVAHAFRGE